MKILIAEDDEDIMTTYKLLFGSTNHELFTAGDGDECVRLFDDQVQHRRDQVDANSGASTPASHANPPFDLVILDYRMPKRNGIQVANHILSVVPSQRIIIASAYTHELVDSNMARKSPNIEMLQKPFEFDVLLQLVEGNATRPRGTTGQNSAAS